jgi:hypothetical protein
MQLLTETQQQAVAGGGLEYCVYDDQKYTPGAIIVVGGGDIYLQCVEVPSMWNLLGINYYAWTTYDMNSGC